MFLLPGGPAEKRGAHIMSLDERRQSARQGVSCLAKIQLDNGTPHSTALLPTLPMGASGCTQTDSTFPMNSRCSCPVTGQCKMAPTGRSGDATRKLAPS